jgi:hypothetical protein
MRGVGGQDVSPTAQGTCPALVHRSLLCRSTTVCSSKRWTCRGGSSPRPRGGARGSIRARVAVRPLPNSALVSTWVETSATTASAHGPERSPDRPDEAQFAMRALHRAPQSPAADQPRSIRSSAIWQVRSGLLPGSGVPQDVDQRSPCPPAHGAQNAKIWTASVVMGIEPTPAQIDESRSTVLTSDRHAARLVFRRLSEPSAYGRPG